MGALKHASRPTEHQGSQRRGEARRSPQGFGKKASVTAGAQLGIEAEQFKVADKVRENMEPSDYKRVVLGFIFLKYTSDTFEVRQKALMAEDPKAAEDKDEYLANNVFWVPKDARQSQLQANAKQLTIWTQIGDAVTAPLRLKAEGNVEQMETIAALRDTLLPRMISGQLLVGDAEKIPETTA